MSFIAQDFDSLKIITILDGRTQAIIRNHFLRYSRAVRSRVKVITMDRFSPYYGIDPPSLSHFQARAETGSTQTVSLPSAKIVLDRFPFALLLWLPASFSRREKQ